MIAQARQSLRILNFDTECRPMHYSEFRAESQITGVAWSWVGEDTVHCELLQQDLSNEQDMLNDFLWAFAQADIVTGHYLRKHDLPLLNDHCIRFGWSPLKRVLVSDTMLDMVTGKGLGKSQENLSHTLDVSADKHHMNGSRWRIANSLSPEGMAGTRKRVIDDVLQNKQLRATLLDRGLLKAPRAWRP